MVEPQDKLPAGLKNSVLGSCMGAYARGILVVDEIHSMLIATSF